MRIVVTGASGFCGAFVARLAAAAGHEVVSVGRRPGPVGAHVPWDAESGDHPHLAGAEAVIHLAAAVGDPGRGRAVAQRFHRINVDGTARLLDAAGGRPVVHVSSASVYTPGVHSGPVPESRPTGGWHTAYGRTKAAGDRLALGYGAVVLRPRAVYGPGDPHLLPRLHRAVRRGRALLPGPDTMMSLTAVENLADACVAALGWPAGPYNVADAHPYPRDATIRAVVGARPLHVPVALANAAAAVSATVSSAVAARPTLTRYAVDQLAHGLVLDLTRAREQGYEPKRTLTDFLWDRT
jgi:nucleoside-diphosphate-sugar epimerase